jgi:hypothetical protein
MNCSKITAVHAAGRSEKNRAKQGGKERTMTTLTVSISDELSRRLGEVSARTGVSPADLARAGLEEWLSRPGDDFEKLAAYVFDKNIELYRRLA